MTHLIRAMNLPCVKGNHDEYCSSDSLDSFTEPAAERVQWTRDQLTDEDRQWLRDLPYVKYLAGFTLVHSTLDQPHKWGYIFDKIAASSHFVHQETTVCFFGHTHVTVAFISDSGVVKGGTYSKFKVEQGRKYLINVGSVGQRRDGPKNACYVIYDLDAASVELRSVEFPPSDSGRDGGGPLPMTKPGGGKPPSLFGRKADGDE